MCKTLRRQPGRLTFADFSEMVAIWLDSER
jgi:hypothetical protein